jgi:hypothetical protein
MIGWKVTTKFQPRNFPSRQDWHHKTFETPGIIESINSKELYPLNIARLQ